MRSSQSREDRRRFDDSGSAVVEFLGVAVIVALVALALIQLVLALHVRNVLASSAYEGAAHAALADRTLSDGEARARVLVEQALGGLDANAWARHVTASGSPAVEVTVSTTMPLVGLWGPTEMSVDARAFDEEGA